MAEAKSKLKGLQGRTAPVHVASPRQHGVPKSTSSAPNGMKVAPKHTPGQRGSKKSF